ncbi:MAG: hypothetical protein ACQES2_04895 [Pseudomonadota bacterium]
MQVHLRTQALVDEGAPLNQIICHTASDYKRAVKNEQFAAEYGGEAAFQNELFRLLEQWERLNRLEAQK